MKFIFTALTATCLLLAAATVSARCTLLDQSSCGRDLKGADPTQHGRYIPGSQNTFQVHFRNFSGQTVWSAVRYKEPSGTWVTKGWFKLAPGESRHVVNTANSYVYARANSSGSRRVWGGGTTLCVHPNNSFTLFNNECYRQSGYKTVGFTQHYYSGNLGGKFYINFN